MFQSVSNITHGMAWLDQHAPGWVDRIDLDVLDVADPQLCPLGQIFGDYLWGLDAIGLSMGYLGGFCAEIGGEAYPALNAAWRAAIADRRLAEHLTVQ